MSALTAGMRAKMLENEAIAGLVGTRIYADVLPAAVPLPAMLYWVVSTLPYAHLTGRSGIEATRIQWECHGKTRIEADAVARACQTYLESAGRGEYGDVTVRGLEIASGMRHSTLPPADGDEEWRYITSFDVAVVHTV